jgi:hypothetical protein
MAIRQKQLDVIDEWFKNGGDEIAARKKYNVTPHIWKKWLADKSFNEAVKDRAEAVQRQSQILITQYKLLATAKLIELCDSDKEETSRKACLDILALQADSAGAPQAKGNGRSEGTDKDDDDGKTMIDGETAAKLLAVLAEK